MNYCHVCMINEQQEGSEILYYKLCGDCYYELENKLEQEVALLRSRKSLGHMTLKKFEYMRLRHLKETSHMSGRMEENEWYQDVVAHGEEAIPFMLWDFEESLNCEHYRSCPFWFVGLRQLTGANPVPYEMRGKIKEMMKAWVEWGRKSKYAYLIDDIRNEDES